MNRCVSIRPPAESVGGWHLEGGRCTSPGGLREEAGLIIRISICAYEVVFSSTAGSSVDESRRKMTMRREDRRKSCGKME